jgi:hypothetical protein
VPLAFHQVLCFQAFANLNFCSPVVVLQKLHGKQQQQAPGQRRGRREQHWRSLEVVIVSFFTALFRSLFVYDDPLCVSRLIQWNPAPAPATTPAMVGDSSGSSDRSHSCSSHYDDLAAHRFKVERDETQRELEVVSKKAGIAELEWEHQRKQLLETIDGESCDLFKLNSALN